jgi:stage V sporulation protein S
MFDDAKDEKVLRVGTGSNAQKVASAIAHGVYDDGSVTLRCIGAGAVNQAVKAIAISRSYAGPRGIDLWCVPGFQTVAGKEGDISAVIFTVTARRG